MAFNIQRFADNVGKFGTIPVNRFEVEFSRPSAVTSYSNDLPEILTLRAERINMPGIVFDSYESRRYGVGPSIKTPVGKSRFNEITVDFIDTSILDIKAFFYDWMNYIVDISGNPTPTFLTGYKSDYAIDMIIKVFNHNNVSPVYTIRIVQAFPVAMADSSLAWSRTNELFKTSVTFAYKNHQPVTGTVETSVGEQTAAPAETTTE